MTDHAPPARRDVAAELLQRGRALADATRPSAARDIDLDKRGIDREEALTRHQPRLTVRERGGR